MLIFKTFDVDQNFDADAVFQPDEVRHAYSIRPTALGLTDPWDDYSMDRALLPPIHNRMVKQPTDAK